jgi:hypothetical protein
MRGKVLQGHGTSCRVATSVAPRSRAAVVSVARPGRRGPVERRQGLVDQQQPGLREQRARQSDALALATGEPVDRVRTACRQRRSAPAPHRPGRCRWDRPGCAGCATGPGAAGGRRAPR